MVRRRQPRVVLNCKKNLVSVLACRQKRKKVKANLSHFLATSPLNQILKLKSCESCVYEIRLEMLFEEDKVLAEIMVNIGEI